MVLLKITKGMGRHLCKGFTQFCVYRVDVMRYACMLKVHSCSRAHSLASPAVKFDFFMEFCDMLGVNDGLMKYDITN